MSYRDDSEALRLEVAQLERENQRLQDRLDEADVRYKKLAAETHEDRKRGTRSFCSVCGGNLLPVAVVAGHDVRNPLPLKLSTLRFGDPTGGFTHAAPIHSLACASCGYIHNFIDFDKVEEG